MKAMMRDRFSGKTWIFWAQLVGCGGIGLFGVILGPLFWSGAMTDAKGDVRPEAGPPLLIIGCCLLAVGMLALFNIISRIPPLIRCYREGIECSLIGALVQRSGCISRVARTGAFLFLHLLVLVGVVIAYRFFSGDHPRCVQLSPDEFGFYTLVSLAAGYVLYRKWYGVRWRLAREFRSLKLDQLTMKFKFGDDWIEVPSNVEPARVPWSSVGWFLEFRDGFLILTGNSGYWVPRRAFAKPGDELELAEMAKVRAGHFDLVNKYAAK